MFIAPVSNADSVKTSVATKRLLPIGNLVPFFLVTSLFFLWAIPNNLNDILIRQFMKSFSLTRFEGGLVQSAFYMGYFLLAIPAALLMRRAGYKAGILTGLLLFATGTFLFYPAAVVGKYWFFLLALFVMASGLAFLETAANPFIAQIGSPESSERRLNFSQAFNPVGAIAGAGVGTVFILSGIELTKSEVVSRMAAGTYAAYLQTETIRVVAPYVVLGLVAVILAGIIWRTPFPVIQSEHEGADDSFHLGELLHQRHFILAVITQFLYVGAQVGTWSYFIQYVQDYTHQPEKVAGYFLIGTLAAFGVGRFSSAWIMQFIPAAHLMGGYAVINILLLAIAIAHPGWAGLWCVFGTSLCMSVMFPTIFALGIKDLGANTKIAGSMLVMSIVGGAVMTPVMGLIAEHTGSIAAAYFVPMLGYIAVVLYAFLGSTPRYAR
jgi:FHS family L-fucose permease-like MFS transporter